MDIVGGPFNHLVPSDQLDDSLLLGQNLECEASDEFEAGQGQPEDSLKNMLSDKDPMFGSASAQFHLLENEDVSFKLGSSTDADDMTTTGASQSPSGGEHGQSSVSQGGRHEGQLQRRQTASRGRVKGRRPGPARKAAESNKQESTCSRNPDGDKSLDAKREALLNRRFGVHEVDSSMNPVVVLRRLTVTVGGYKIELLPGPSHAFGSFSTSALQSLGFQDDGVTGDGLALDIGQNQDDATQEVAQEVVGEMSVGQSTSDDMPMDFGPYVNPNEVQDTNSTTPLKPSVDNATPADAKKNDQIKTRKLSAQKTGNKNGTAVQPGVKKLLKHKQALSAAKNKPSHLTRPGLLQKISKHPRDKKVHTSHPEGQKGKPVKMGLKRPGGPLTPKSPSKIQKIQDGQPANQTVNPPIPVSPTVSRKLSSDSGPSVKSVQSPHPPKKPQNPPTPVNKTNTPVTNSQGEEEQEKVKIKKPEKIQQRHKSRNSRSISVEEPQLFIPDNAPVVKKEAEGEPLPESETVWDPSKHCGLCKKPHNNRFMVGCGRCDEWFHGDCVGLDLAKVQQMEKEDQEYVCLKCCAEEDGKTGAQATEQSDDKLSAKQKQRPQQSLTAGGIRPFRKDVGERRPSEDSASKGPSVKHMAKKVKISPVTSKKPSTGQIRRSVRDSLEEILLKRLKEADLKISLDKPAELARRTEKELFALFQGVDSKYKNKYRSLTFNLKDAKNNVLFKRVLKGEVSPADLVRMTAEELASKELAAWRQRENRHTIEMIEKEQREVERRPITKITHKGEIEIENQEPAKAPEAIEVEPEPVPKAAEVPEEKPPETKADSPKKSVDTTNLHKSHLFDLNCKICTGRMAPPTEEAATKVVKVATTVVRRQSSTTDESQHSTTTPTSALIDDLSLRAMEEGLLNFLPESRSDSLSSKEDTATFLSSLESLWGGFVDMPAVARFLTKAYPVSGILDHLTQDLPDNIQVGGRISPQIVWDYVEKIRASGTKEICVIRFTPDTEEDEISYTLLYAYFSSRRRYGVVANNRKQVKDMYLIPLGSTEKIPHQIVPFDGPGLETNRPNLLLGLVIRQRPKRDFGVILPSDVSEAPSFLAESKPHVDYPQKAPVAQDVERSFISTLGSMRKKDSADLIKSVVEEPILDTETDENVSLRFLPGVLKLPGIVTSSSNDTVKSDTTTTVSKSPTVDTGNNTEIHSKPTATTPRLDRFIIKKKDPKAVKTEQAPSSSSLETSTEKKESGVILSLSDKPADVSTESFLSSLTVAKPKEESVSGSTAAPDSQETTSSDVLKDSVNDSSCFVPKNEIVSSPTKTLKTSPPGILKTASSSAEPIEVKPQQPESNSEKKVTPQPSAQECKAIEDIQAITTISSIGKNEGLKQSRTSSFNPKVYNQTPIFHSYHAGPPDPQYYPPPANPAPYLPPQVPPPFPFPPGPPPPQMFPQSDPHMLPPPWAQTVPPQTHSAPPLTYESSLPTSSPLSKDEKASEKSYGDLGEKPSRRSDETYRKDNRDRDHYDRHHHKSRHYDRDREKHRDRSHSHKERHSKEERYDRQRERHHSGSHHRDRDKHRRDSDYEKHRRDSRDRRS
ncbi:PHD finger protein 3 [Labeo rohita]|uniref:PHD finger protein 3 n=1 Tax=Labeo rohita TaxID=84645 RepID=UPI0021E2A91A|nr:PHD finger protein 3 [Labeo rohita]XP_050981716.1 PHD finger protein 3 [Labeo rohita]XP_050981717.1 PHD finger protein 3 [Labeo rohita]